MRRVLQRITRGFACMAAALAAILTLTAHAQESNQSTWQRVHETKTLRLAGTNSEFWAFKDTSGNNAPGSVKIGEVTWRGVGPTLGKALADALGVKLEIVETTWGNAVAGLQAGQFDLIFGLDGTPQRAAAIDFVPQALFWYGTALAAKPSQNIATWTAINKAKMRVGVPAGTSMELELTSRAPNAQISRFQTFNEMIAAMQAGRIDALAGSLTSATIISARMKDSQVKMPEPAALYPAGTGIRKELDPRWRNFLTTSLQYFATNGLVQSAMNDVYTFRGVDISKIQPVVQR